MKIDVRMDKRKFDRRIRKLKKFNHAVKYQTAKFRTKAVKKLIRVVSGDILKTRTAFLRRNIGDKIVSTKTSVTLTIGTGVGGKRSVKYASIHDKGGRIRPKRRKYLTIPFEGVKGRASNYPDSFVLKSSAGNLIIAERKGTGFRPLFSLQKHVDIPKRDWFTGTFKSLRPDLKQSLSKKSILEAIKRIS